MNNIEKAKKIVDCVKEKKVTYICNNSSNTVDVANTYTVNSNEKAKVKNVGTNKNALLEFYIPKGDAGPSLIDTAYLVTFENNFTDEGIEIKALGKLPITRVELDTGNIISLENNQIKFNKDGFYKVTFIARSYVKTNAPFDASKDFVSLGFREENTDNIYIGASDFILDSASKSIYAQGLLSVYDTTKAYELVNLSKRSIYLKTPDLENINSNSYFVNALVSITIEYLGKGN